MKEYIARYGKASQKDRRNGKMRRQKRSILQKITAAALSAALRSEERRVGKEC